MSAEKNGILQSSVVWTLSCFLTYTVFAAIRYIGALLNSLIFIFKMYHKRCLKSVYCVMLGKHINRNVAFLL